MKAAFILVCLGMAAFSHFTYPGSNSPYGRQQGLFIPSINKVTAETTNDVVYNRFCKAICYLYVPLLKTCGLNNIVYENECQARCDRVGTDQSRLKFNEKCCCSGGSHKVDASFAKGETDAKAPLTPSAFCINVPARNSSNVDDTNNIMNVFIIPTCIARCLDIDSHSDLEYVDPSRTYKSGCYDNT